MVIRHAVRGDAAKAVPLILQAIGSIAYVMTGATDAEEAASILTDFFEREQNRVSYENALVLEEDGELVGLVIFYDGAGVPGPKRLYERLGFRVDYTKWIAGQEYFHMVREL